MTRFHPIRGHNRFTDLAAFGHLRPCGSKPQPRHEAYIVHGTRGLPTHDNSIRGSGRTVASFADAKVRDAQDNESAREREGSQLEPSTSDAAQESSTDLGMRKLHLAQWYLAETEKPAFLAVEAILAVAFLGLLDAGLSGVHDKAFSPCCAFSFGDTYFPLFLHATVELSASIKWHIHFIT
jgi:hypothetical protein